MTEYMTEYDAKASAVSRIINARAGKHVRRRLHLAQTTDGRTTVWTPNGARHQAAALSAARRALISAGYEVLTSRGRASLPLAPHVYYLSVLRKRPSRPGDDS